MQKIKLYAPDDTPILGVKLVNGDYEEVELSYDRSLNHSLWTYGNKKEVAKHEDENRECILMDINGKEWPLSDVEIHSLLR